MAATIHRPEDEVVRICQELIRIDTSNYGDGSGPGEAAAADYVVRLVREVGLEPTVVESSPGRTSVVVRIDGADPERPALCLHGHLDVVPARAEDWKLAPFSGEERDGCLWGRGAVDMKDMVAMLLVCARDLARRGARPPRDLVFAFFADEEAGGVLGSHYVVDHHPELFAGVTEAVSEVGGYSITLPTTNGGHGRAYLVQVAEKGILWLRLRSRGRAGHGSVPNPDNAILRLSAALGRVSAHPWPREYLASVRGLLDGVSAITGTSYTDDQPEPVLAHLRAAQPFVRGTLHDTATPTMLESGYKHNVVPQTAAAALDCRFLPGHEDHLLETIRTLAGPDVEVEVVHRDIALETPFDGPLVEAMERALLAEDPEAEVLPYCLCGGTDNKALSKLGITGYGFAPLRLPPELDFVSMFHGVNERVPVEALLFGTRVLRRLLATC